MKEFAKELSLLASTLNTTKKSLTKVREKSKYFKVRHGAVVGKVTMPENENMALRAEKISLGSVIFC